MNLTLTRLKYQPDGIFSYLTDETGTKVSATCEHAYAAGPLWAPKLIPGVYTCIKGQHRLASMSQDFTTFEITGVVGCTGILFHKGNYNADSRGCVLLGDYFDDDVTPTMTCHSAVAFQRFMTLQADVDTFILTVVA